MWISKKRYEEFKKQLQEALEKVLELNKKLDFFIKENSELREKLDVLSEKKKKADALCKGCKHLIEGKKQSGPWATDVYECDLNRTCKDFDEKDRTDMEQVIEFVEKLGKGN